MSLTYLKEGDILKAVRNLFVRLIELAGPYLKSLVPAGVAGVLGLLAYVGVRGEMTVEELVTMLITGAVVFLVPNKEKSRE